MKLLFVVLDSKANLYLDPFAAPTVDYAIRGFAHLANQPGHDFNTFPEDFVLFHIGEYNPETGEVTAMPPRSLGVAQSFVNSSALGDSPRLHGSANGAQEHHDLSKGVAG